MPLRTFTDQGHSDAIHGGETPCVRTGLSSMTEDSEKCSHLGSWYQNSSNGTNQFRHEEEFLRHTWDFKKSTELLPAGNYEWPFDMVITGSTPESLEGLQDTWIIYRMKATIERGMLQQNSIARKQVRIIRSLDPTALELAHSMVRYARIDVLGRSLIKCSLWKTYGLTNSNTLSALR